jgi:two-component system, NarL family, sensor histidine kinase DegS
MGFIGGKRMKVDNVDVKALDKVVDKMIQTVDQSKDEIFNIGERCRQDYEAISLELEEVKKMFEQVIAEGEELEVKSRLARNRLSEVNKNFHQYTEEQVREAYEKAHEFHTKLQINHQVEKQLRDRRDELERRLRSLEHTIERAEHLVSQVSVVLNYLQTDFKQVGEMIKDAKEKKDFGLRIIEAQEEERKRLSREIHDGPAQMLANVLMRSDLIDRVYRERSPEEALKEIRSLKQMVRSALYEVRRIIYNLRPMALDDLGLIPTLKKYLQTIEEYHKGTKIHFTNYGLETRLPPNYEVALFRLIQESVQNALKHAQAHEIQVKVDIQNHQVTAVVKDDGKGFDPSVKQPGSFGIMGMKERVDLLEGELSIRSKIGVGTVVYIQVPLKK